MLLQLNDITKTFSNDTVLSGVSLKIEEGERVAIVGVNGTVNNIIKNYRKRFRL